MFPTGRLASVKARAFVEYVQGLLAKSHKTPTRFVYCDFRLFRITFRHSSFPKPDSPCRPLFIPPSASP
ncbi:hypothetical protein C1891_07305 [Pseudomonas sp. GW456-12-1-14-TSB6]|nr:hypothetical protein C1891_07305 [Pseudomonas sp. GW456-12-1-14-TSB6]